ncbi:MAG: hypothetical protein PHF29_10165 [Candidatus Riflebacteria bacterium]|nr:hypothetical protein [Candidatus Riflebacteria bacterium]
MRKLSLAFLVSIFVSSFFNSVSAADLSQFSDKLSQITDVKLQTTLKNSIQAGLIETEEDFDKVVARAESSANSNSTIYYSAYDRAADVTSMSKKISSLVNPIRKLDKDAVKVIKNEKNNTDKLFQDLTTDLPKSYKATIDLCNKFNPKVGTAELKSNGKAIDAYFQSIKNDPCIQHALSVTNTSVEQLKQNWFGAGAGFEHVIAGEIKGSKVSGYHWWYRFYDDERRGHAEVINAVAGIGNPNIYTGSFTWDPDGNGPLPTCRKPKGGFTTINSAQALLAMGHIAIETVRSLNNGKVLGAFTFHADINGESFTWQMYTLNGTIRSMYPMTSSKHNKTNSKLIVYEYDEE